MTYNFKNLRYGDLVEITGWQKGSTGGFAIAGSGSNCEPYFLANKLIHYRDSAGWGYMNYVFTVTTKCDSSNVNFFVWNPDTTTTVFFDDIKFSIKKYDKNYLDSALLVK
jgi:hypothetical protein